jgi:hypothetical protein
MRKAEGTGSGSLVVLEGQGNRVTQAELENIMAFEAVIARTRKMRDELSARILSRISNGAAVEDGNRTYDIGESYQGQCRIQKLIVR